MASRSVFISYSRADSADVHDAVELLRAGGVKVFLDVADIDFGERWKDVLFKALNRCERVMVFWSQAAAASEWVGREWRYAIELGKKIVPTLLDLTPLPAELAEYQAIKRLRPAAKAANSAAAPAFGGSGGPHDFSADTGFGASQPAAPFPTQPEPSAPTRSAAPPVRSSTRWVVTALLAAALGGAVAFWSLRTLAPPSRVLPSPQPPASAASAPALPASLPLPLPASAPVLPPPAITMSDERLVSLPWLVASGFALLAAIALGMLAKLRRRAPPEALAFVDEVFRA
jgi:TIR domain